MILPVLERGRPEYHRFITLVDFVRNSCSQPLRIALLRRFAPVSLLDSWLFWVILARFRSARRGTSSKVDKSVQKCVKVVILGSPASEPGISRLSYWNMAKGGSELGPEVGPEVVLKVVQKLVQNVVRERTRKRVWCTASLPCPILPCPVPPCTTHPGYTSSYTCTTSVHAGASGGL